MRVSLDSSARDVRLHACLQILPNWQSSGASIPAYYLSYRRAVSYDSGLRESFQGELA